MRRFLRIIAALGLGLMLAACDGGSNPLIGTWRMVPEKGNALSQGLGFLMQNQTVEFREDSMIAAGEASKVTYEVQDGRVIVYPQGAGDGRGTVYLILDENRIANELPLGQRVVFERVQG